MTERAPECWKRLRYRSEDEYRSAVEAKAREIWDKREHSMWGDDPKWKNYRQSWEQGTGLARDRTLIQAERELDRAAKVDRSPKGRDVKQARLARAAVPSGICPNTHPQPDSQP